MLEKVWFSGAHGSAAAVKEVIPSPEVSAAISSQPSFLSVRPDLLASVGNFSSRNVEILPQRATESTALHSDPASVQTGTDSRGGLLK